MGFLKSRFTPSAGAQGADSYSISVQCDRCNEVIEARINLNNDLTPTYDDEAEQYDLSKVLTGSNHCFQRIEVKLKFDAAKRLLEKHASGGRFV